MQLAATLQGIPSGKDGVLATLKIMRRLVLKSKKTLPIRMEALKMVRHLPQKDFIGEIGELFSFVQNDIRYVKDIRGIETVQWPEMTLQIGQGDCDDKSTLLSSLLESIGFRTRFKAIGLTPGKFSHVYIQVFFNNKWVSLDATMPHGVGWEPKNIVERATLLI